MTEDQKKTKQLNQRPGSCNWLTSLPLTKHSYIFNKKQFWDAICIRYNWALPNLPVMCVYGFNYNLQH